MSKLSEKIQEFDEKEKLRIRMKMEEYDMKCKRRVAQLMAYNQNIVKELEEIHVRINAVFMQLTGNNSIYLERKTQHVGGQ